MTEPENPFDDPEVAAAMEAAGIVHKPGMAAELMQEVAPLLKAEGIDLDNPSEHVSLDALNEAFGRVMEQYNLGLFTPVATHREQTLAVITEFAQALTHKRLRGAEAVLDSIQPEPTAERPAASHVIGTSLGMLDVWYSDAQLNDALGDVQLPKWRGPARSIAARLIRAGRVGDAYASLGQLIARHGGLLVLQAGALAAAGTILTYADQRGMEIPEAADYLLNYSRTSRPSRVNNHKAFVEFEDWMGVGDGLAPDDQTDLELFHQIVSLADAVGVDLATPDGVGALVDAIADFDSEEAAGAALSSLDSYVHFRLAQDVDFDEWDDVHEEIVERLVEFSPEAAELADVIAAANELSEAERREAFGEVRIVQAVGPLLEWLGASQAVTGTGGVRRADIETVAAMIGVPAVGSARKPPQAYDLMTDFAEEGVYLEPETIYAQSTGDVLQLSAWWEALEFAGITERGATRVRPGRRAADFKKADLPPLETAEALVSVFIAELLVQNLNDDEFAFSAVITSLVLERLRAAVTDREHEISADEAGVEMFVTPRVLKLMQMLEHAGVLDSRVGTPRVPTGLKGAVANSILMVASVLMEQMEDEEGGWDH